MGLSTLDDSYDGIARFLARNPGTSFAALKGDELIGAILCGHDGRRGYIYNTAVSEVHRKKGVGRALAEAALNALEKEGINNSPAFHF